MEAVSRTNKLRCNSNALARTTNRTFQYVRDPKFLCNRTNVLVAAFVGKR